VTRHTASSTPSGFWGVTEGHTSRQLKTTHRNLPVAKHRCEGVRTRLRRLARAALRTNPGMISCPLASKRFMPTYVSRPDEVGAEERRNCRLLSPSASL
jgi:hypothetical protein